MVWNISIENSDDLEDELKYAIYKRVKGAQNNGLPRKREARLREIMEKHKTVFGQGSENPNQPLSRQ